LDRLPFQLVEDVGELDAFPQQFGKLSDGMDLRWIPRGQSRHGKIIPRTAMPADLDDRMHRENEHLQYPNSPKSFPSQDVIDYFTGALCSIQTGEYQVMPCCVVVRFQWSKINHGARCC
jgi:hypothetical protein